MRRFWGSFISSGGGRRLLVLGSALPGFCAVPWIYQPLEDSKTTRNCILATVFAKPKAGNVQKTRPLCLRHPKPSTLNPKIAVTPGRYNSGGGGDSTPREGSGHDCFSFGFSVLGFRVYCLDIY